MITRLEGTLTENGAETVVSVGGVGLALQMPDAGALPPVGETVRCWTHLAVREDGWTLYGFVRRVERELFRLLISVNGVGPKLGLAMLAGAGAEEIARRIASGDEKGLARLPGIGPKSAARLVVELGKKMPGELLAGGAAGEPDAAAVRRAATPMSEAIDVLGAMGVPTARAEKALAEALDRRPDLGDDLEGWVRETLRELA